MYTFLLDFSAFKGILHSKSFEDCDKKSWYCQTMWYFHWKAFLKRIRFQTMIFSLLKLNLLLQTIYLCYTWPKFSYLFPILTTTKKQNKKISSNAGFTIGVPKKNALLGSCHRFQKKNILPQHFCRTKKKSGLCL